MTALVAKLAGSACAFLSALVVVAAWAVLFVTVMMPFVFPLFLVGAALLDHPLEQQNAAHRTPSTRTGPASMVSSQPVAGSEPCT
jgi:predicted metal-binding membrane protein